MESTRIELFREALDLNEKYRATLAGFLLESLEPEPAENIDRLWLAEIERRVHELDTGKVNHCSCTR